MGNFRNFLPSGQFTVTVAALLIVGGLVFVAEIFPNTSGTVSYSNPTASLSVGEAEKLVDLPADIDTDNDGLKDWEEGLWKTSATKADTDGDSTNDGDEVKAGRNPLVKGPKDKLATDAPIITKNGLGENGELTPTDIFAREFFAEYSRLKASGQPVGSSTETALIAKVLTSKNVVGPARVYTEGELRVITDNGSVSLKNYGNEMALILKNDPYAGGDNALTILNRAVQNNDQKGIEKLDSIITGYQVMITQMLNTSVPKSAAGVHLRMVNALSVMLDALKHMRTVFTDPVSAVVAVGRYTDTLRGIPAAFTELQKFFQSKNIQFNTNESGAIFNNVYTY